MSKKASTTGGEIINTKVFYIRSQDGKNFGKNVDGGKVTTAFDVVLDEPIQCEPHQVLYASLNDIQLPWSWFSTDRTNNQFVVMMQFNGGNAIYQPPWGGINWTQDGSTYVQRYVLSADQFPYDPTRPLPTMVRPSENAARPGGVTTYARHGNTPPNQVGNAFCCQDVRAIPKGNYTPQSFATQIQTMLNRPWAEGGFADVGYNIPAAPTNQFYVTYNQTTNSLYFGLQYTDTGLAVNNSFGEPNVLGPRVYLIWNDIILPNGTGGYYGNLAAAQEGEVYGDPQGTPGWFFPAGDGLGGVQNDPDAGVPGTGVPALSIQPFNIFGPERPAFSQFGFGPKGNILPILNPNNSKIENIPSNWKMDANIGGGFIILNFPPLNGMDWWSYGTAPAPLYISRTPPDTPNMQAFRSNINYPGGFEFWGAGVPTNLDTDFYFTPSVMDWAGERHRCIYVRTSMTTARSHSTRVNNRTDILAKIPVQQITDTHAEELHNNDMVTYGKEENMGIKLDAKKVQHMRIELTDDDGVAIDLNGLDWTMSLRFDIAWKPAYVMWNSGRRTGDSAEGHWTDPQAAAHHRILLMREYDAWRRSQIPVPPPEQKRDRSKEEGNKPASLTAEEEERKEAINRGWVKERPLEDTEARHQLGLT